jgi:hypothetical protein
MKEERGGKKGRTGRTPKQRERKINNKEHTGDPLPLPVLRTTDLKQQQGKKQQQQQQHGMEENG